MKKDLGIKTFIYPQPVLVVSTYDEFNNPDAMVAAWGGVADYNKVIICLSNHKTTRNLAKNKDFTISIAEAKYVKQIDYLGIVSQDDEPNKMAKSQFTTTVAKYVNAPVINELALTLECRVIKILEDSLYLAEIINVNASEEILDENNNLIPEKFTPISYDPSTHGYYKVEERVGNAFQDGEILK